LVQRIQRLVSPPPAHRLPNPRGIDCPATARYYGNVMRAMAALGEQFGFPLLVFQQPVDATSDKTRSGWEKTFPRDAEGRATIRRCASAIDSAMVRRPGYFSLAHIFDADTETVFMDQYSHLTEAANARVAHFMADALIPVLGPARRLP
jgi:hypothetical protein